MCFEKFSWSYWRKLTCFLHTILLTLLLLSLTIVSQFFLHHKYPQLLEDVKSSLGISHLDLWEIVSRQTALWQEEHFLFFLLTLSLSCHNMLRYLFKLPVQFFQPIALQIIKYLHFTDWLVSCLISAECSVFLGQILPFSEHCQEHFFYSVRTFGITQWQLKPKPV